MKYFNTLVFLFSFFTFIQAQQISFGNEAMADGLRPASSIIIENVDAKYVDNVWKNYIKKYGGKYKWDRKSGQHNNEGTLIPNISSNVLQATAVTKAAGNNTQFYIWLKDGQDFINPMEDSTAKEQISSLLSHFALEVSREKLKDDIKEEEKNLSRMATEIKKLERQNDKLHKDIEDYKNKIAKAESDILENVKQQTETNVNIEKQNETINAMKQRLSKL